MECDTQPVAAISVLKIAVPSPLRRVFDYLAVTKQSDITRPLVDVPVGVRVWVSFNNRKLIGVVVGRKSSTDVPKNKLKPVLEVIDESPVLGVHLLALCEWVARYYHHPLGEVATHALPALLRKGEPAAFRQEKLWLPTTKGKLVAPESLGTRATRQQAALQVLQQHPKGLSVPMLNTLVVQSAQLNALAKKGLAEVVSVGPEAVASAHASAGADVRLAEPELALNEEQAAALAEMTVVLDQFKTFLLDGVTGSGKTEVYLQLIHQVLARGQQALVLVPEIGLTPQTIARFQHRFACRVVALHSGLNHRERLDGWLYAKSGAAGIVIGTRSAIYTPFASLGVIIVDEEHDSSFKQQDGLRYSARDLAVYRGQQANIPVVLGTATPSLESWVNAQRGRYQKLVLSQRAGAARAPRIDIIDIRKSRLQEGFSEALLQAMRDTLAAENQVLVFINRRGFAPTLMCHDCGWVHTCRACDVRMTVHKQFGEMRCHHCGHAAPIRRACPDCGSQDLLALGTGTEKIEETLAVLFPDYPVVRIDRDSTRRKDAMQKLVDRVHSSQSLILVGTQMLAKGHHFPNVTLVAIKDADAGFFACDFRASEKMAQLLLQVAGRAGRAAKPGRVMMQSHQPDHPAIQLLVRQGYAVFVESLLQERKLAELPPYSFLALIRCEGVKMAHLMGFLQHVADTFLGLTAGPQVLGPIPAPMERKAGLYRAQLLLQSTDRAVLHRALSAVIPVIETLRESRTVRWSVDVDPIDLN